MATTDTSKVHGNEKPAPKRPDAGDQRQPGSGVAGPLEEVQHDRTRAAANEEEHEGATEQQVGDRGGPGVGFDQEPEREKDEGGVS